MSDKKLLYFTDMEFIEPEPIDGNPMLSKVKIRIAQAGVNRNGFDIPKEVLEHAAKTSLGLTPIVALYNHYNEDFGQHGVQAVYNRVGEYVTTEDTQAVGVIPENPEFYWDSDGYLVTFGYLWTTRYGELVKALEGRPQSMELSYEKTVMIPRGNIIEIAETAFEGLCILGTDVTPAFAQASIKGVNFSYIEKEEGTKVQKGVDKIMSELKFALDNNFDDSSLGTPLVVDTDGEERDKKNREKVSEAIDILDEAADTIVDEEVRNSVDDAISGLVDAEIDMKKEADILPVTEAARRGLQGQPGYKDGVVSTENINYAKSSNSLLKKNKDEDEEDKELATKKREEELEIQNNPEKVEDTETKEVPVVEETKEEVVTEEVPAQEEVVEEDIPSEGEATIEQEPVGTEEVAPAPEAETDEVVAPEQEAVNPGEEVQEDPQGETATAIASERKTAENQRTSKLLSDIGDDELLSYLVERLGNIEDMKTRLQEVLGTSIPDQLPEGGEVPVDETQTTDDELGVQEVRTPKNAETPEIDVEGEGNDSELAAEGEEVTKEESVEEVIEIDEGGATEEGEVPAAPAEEAPAETETTEEAPVTEETEEEKKRRLSHSTVDYSLDFKAIIKENAELTEANEKLAKQNSELLQFKAKIEKDEKEKTLLEFNISDEAANAIRLDFDSLSIEDVEARAALTQHREYKQAHGQKRQVEGIEFSLETGEVEPIKTDDYSLEAVLEKAKQNIQSRR